MIVDNSVLQRIVQDRWHPARRQCPASRRLRVTARGETSSKVEIQITGIPALQRAAHDLGRASRAFLALAVPDRHQHVDLAEQESVQDARRLDCGCASIRPSPFRSGRLDRASGRGSRGNSSTVVALSRAAMKSAVTSFVLSRADACEVGQVIRLRGRAAWRRDPSPAAWHRRPSDRRLRQAPIQGGPCAEFFRLRPSRRTRSFRPSVRQARGRSRRIRRAAGRARASPRWREMSCPSGDAPRSRPAK